MRLVLTREGRAELDHVARLVPRFGLALGLLGRELALEGQVAEARSLAERAYAAAPRHPNAVGFLAGMLRQRGEAARSDDVLASLDRERAWALPRALAEARLVCRDIAGTIEALRAAVREKDPGIWLVVAEGPVWGDTNMGQCRVCGGPVDDNGHTLLPVDPLPRHRLEPTLPSPPDNDSSSDDMTPAERFARAIDRRDALIRDRRIAGGAGRRSTDPDHSKA